MPIQNVAISTISQLFCERSKREGKVEYFLWIVMFISIIIF